VLLLYKYRKQKVEQPFQQKRFCSASEREEQEAAPAELLYPYMVSERDHC